MNLKRLNLLLFSFIFLVAAITEYPTSEDMSYKLPDEVPYNTPTQVYDTTLALRLGMFGFHIPSNSHGSCASCHDIQKAGFSKDKFPVGKSGLFDLMYQNHNPGFVIDRQTVRTQPVINACFSTLALTGGELGAMNQNLGVSMEKLTAFKHQNGDMLDGIYTQVNVAFDAH